METPDIKIISHNAANFRQPDDPSYPWKLYINLRPPKFMQVAFCLMHGGSEEIVARGKSKETLEAFAAKYGLNANHPRFRRMEVTGPDPAVENSEAQTCPYREFDPKVELPRYLDEYKWNPEDAMWSQCASARCRKTSADPAACAMTASTRTAKPITTAAATAGKGVGNERDRLRYHPRQRRSWRLSWRALFSSNAKTRHVFSYGSAADAGCHGRLPDGNGVV